MSPLQPRGRPPLPVDPADTAPLGAAFADTLERDLLHLGFGLSAGQRAAIEAHARLLLAWNEAINLTALRTPAQVAREHVIDSLTAVGVLRAGGPGGDLRLLDIGSGGGYPGLPLGVVVGAVELGLLDSIRKKASFLRVAAAAVTRVLLDAGQPGPRAVVFAERAETLARLPDHRERWDVITARAVGDLAELVELALPLLNAGGRLVAWKRAPGLDDELRGAGAVLRSLRSDPSAIDLHLVPIPELADHRLVVVHKTAPTPAGFPRTVVERRRATTR